MAVEWLWQLIAFWREWGILSLVLLSLLLQVTLYLTAEIRRRKDNVVLKLVVWTAYMLTDTTAVYALGHMSVTVRTSNEHRLLAFWAAFLLLHLGGQDNITAYAIEDNKLWLRHLQSWVIQVLMACYVLHESSILAGQTLLRPATILMFLVGIVKYGEKVWVLKSACISDLSGKNYRWFNKWIAGFARDSIAPARHRHNELLAMQLLDYARNLLKEPLPCSGVNKIEMFDWDTVYGVAEVQLFLMHDVFYSKAEFIHSWPGYCIRISSLLSIVAAFILFSLLGEKHGYRAADVVTSYILLGGALILETTSFLRAMCSIWIYTRVSTDKKLGSVSGFKSCVTVTIARLARIPFQFRSCVRTMCAMCRGGGHVASGYYWSGSMGQHNFIDMCTDSKKSRGSKISRWIGREDWWNTLVYTSSVPVSRDISRLLEQYLKASTSISLESPRHIHNSLGRVALNRIPGLHEELGWLMHMEVDQSILVWHIATDVYLDWYRGVHDQPHKLAQVILALSNYMMFLLAVRPYMLPNNASRQAYIHICETVSRLDHRYREQKDLCRLLQEKGNQIILMSRSDEDPGRVEDVLFERACQLATRLIGKDMEIPDVDIMEVISQVWVEIMCYAAYHCTPESHARQLSNGGEYTTIVALLLQYTKYGTSMLVMMRMLQDAESSACND
uniref:Uncharacterized protein n=1 Tax=Avena sativa TaxID=4498 RepID=A0ACD5ZKM6_AVESA